MWIHCGAVRYLQIVLSGDSDNWFVPIDNYLSASFNIPDQQDLTKYPDRVGGVYINIRGHSIRSIYHFDTTVYR